jgi:hypothetical protein
VPRSFLARFDPATAPSRPPITAPTSCLPPEALQPITPPSFCDMALAVVGAVAMVRAVAVMARVRAMVLKVLVMVLRPLRMCPEPSAP